MRLLCLVIMCSALFLSCDRKQDKVSTDLINIKKSDANTLEEKLPVITFDGETFEFNNVVEGEKIQHTFKFENTGDAPLIISRVEPSCGCTTAKNWSSKPYAPGDSGEITIDFDTNERPGVQNKSIQVIANTNPAVTNLYLKGNVIGPETN